LLGFLRTNIRQIYSKFTPGHPTKTKNHLLTAPIAYFLSQCQKVSKTGGIGNTNPTEKLVVDGKILAEEVTPT
jgi:hypothetical protein